MVMALLLHQSVPESHIHQSIYLQFSSIAHTLVFVSTLLKRVACHCFSENLVQEIRPQSPREWHHWVIDAKIVGEMSGRHWAPEP